LASIERPFEKLLIEKGETIQIMNSEPAWPDEISTLALAMGSVTVPKQVVGQNCILPGRLETCTTISRRIQPNESSFSP
jgi:hypothetical protein